MSDERETNPTGDTGAGYGKPPKHSRFKPGQTGNPRGRPPKKHQPLLPRQWRAQFLQIMEEEVTVDTPKGRKRMTTSELFLRAIVRRAHAGNPTAMKLVTEMVITALRDRLESNGAFRIIDDMVDGENRAKIAMHRFAEEPDYDLAAAAKGVY